mgnify:CR=1 FL=1
MKPKLIKNNLIREEYFYMKHPSGLDIYVHPKKRYASSYAILGTNFGSVNNKFRKFGEESYTVVPDGIAHYLEHKLFEGKEGDAFELFAKTGASANAYTSFEKTAYLFSCTGNFQDSLNILLDFVQSPYFTEKNVEKEREIIGQEIKMYEDSPDWKVLINLLGALYKNHPVRNDIAGSVESISKITPELLYECYNTFYNLNNMCLCVVGNVDPDAVFTSVDKKLKYSPQINVERFFPTEPKEIMKPEITQTFDIVSPIFSIGFKENVSENHRATTEEMVYSDLILQCVGSRTSEMYQELMKEELINTSSFSNEYFEGPGYSSVIFSGESKNPYRAAEIIKKHVQKIKSNGIDEELFQRIKKSVYGQSLSVFNSVSGIANLTLDFSLSGKDIFEYIDILQNANISKANQALDSKLNSEFSAISIAKPKNE